MDHHSKFHNFLFAILLLITCANTTNAVGSGTDDENDESRKFLVIFDNAIRQFVEYFNTDQPPQQQQQQQFHLTYTEAAHILKGIEEKVANQVIAAEEKSQANQVIAAEEKNHDQQLANQAVAAEEKKRHIELGDFHGILGQIGKDILHREMVFKWGISKLQHELESMEPKKQKATNALLFYRLLTFAIRMGFTIGQTALKAAGMPKQIDLHKLVRAHNYLEKLFWYEWEKAGQQQKVWFKNETTENLLKLDFNSLKWEAWHEWRINQNLATINKLLHNSPEVTIEGWLNLVARIRNFSVENSSPMDSSSEVGSLLIQLMTSWTGKPISAGRHWVATIEYCAALKFSMNLVQRLKAVEKFKNYLARYVREGIVAENYALDCTYMKLLANGYEGIMDENMQQARELSLLSIELFMHYEDAIPLNGLKTDEEIEIENAKTVIQKKLDEWNTKFADCHLHSDDNVNKVALSLIGEECDFKDFSLELHKFQNKFQPSINAAVQTLHMGNSMQILLNLHHRMTEEMNAANSDIRTVRFRQMGVRDHLHWSAKAKFEAKQRADINAEVKEMEIKFGHHKRAMLTLLKALMFDCGGSFSKKS